MALTMEVKFHCITNLNAFREEKCCWALQNKNP